jgi:hypothetical protein
MPASAAITARRCPIRSASADQRRRDDLGPDRRGENDGDLLRVETVSREPHRPERKLHADDKKRGRTERRQPGGGPAVVSLPPQSRHPLPSTLLRSVLMSRACCWI